MKIKVYFGLFFAVSLLSGVWFFSTSNHQRKPAQFSEAELEYAEDIFIHKQPEVDAGLSIAPLWNPDLEPAKEEIYTLDQNIEKRIQEQYHEKLFEALVEQGKNPPLTPAQENLKRQGEVFRQRALAFRRQKKVAEIQEEARKQGFKVTVDPTDDHTLYIEEIQP